MNIPVLVVDNDKEKFLIDYSEVLCIVEQNGWVTVVFKSMDKFSISLNMTLDEFQKQISDNISRNVPRADFLQWKPVK